MRSALLFISLLVFWCFLSGVTIDPSDAEHPINVQLVIASLISAALVVWISVRMGIVDGEGQPLRGLGSILVYLPWLTWQIVRANFEIARVVWSPRLPIQPRFVELPLRLRSPLARLTYANSITLTPGTVTIQVDDDHLLVHALTDSTARDLESRVMEAKLEPLDAKARSA
ncbi:MAG: Na+/H+ antiporter subunit E [Planctomycetes bacterium]|nr:Na+/H+ antiporter subunit E [Planctomycetota bacterium]